MNFAIYYTFVGNGLILFVGRLSIKVYLVFFVNCQIDEKLIHSHTCAVLMWIELGVIFIQLPLTLVYVIS